MSYQPCTVRGYIKSAPSDDTLSFSDVREGFENAQASIPSDTKEHNLTDLVPVVNQLSLGSCVANATAGALEILLGIQDPTSVVMLSRLFLYWNSRLASKTTDKDDGTMPSICFSEMTALGVCSEKTWPYAVSQVFSQPPLQAYREGIDNKITAAYNVDDGDKDQMLNDMEIAVKANHPVVFATSVDVAFTEDFELAENASTFDPPNSSMIAGNHCMIVVGIRYDANGKRQYKIKNSWGTSWGFGGYCWFTENYIKLSFDVWVPTLVPNILL